MSLLLFWYGGWGFAVPRIILGALLTAHGWPKIKDLRQNARNFRAWDFGPAGSGEPSPRCSNFLVASGWCSAQVPYLCVLFMGEFVVIIIWKWFKQMPFVSGWELDAIIFSFALIFFTLYGGWFLI